MRANRIEYLFSVNTHTPPTMTVDSGEEFRVEVRGAFDDIEDVSAVPTPFTPACDGHPLAPITGPIVVRGAKPGDVVAIDLIELTPFGSGKSAILRDFGVLRREFPEPMALSSARLPRTVRRPDLRYLRFCGVPGPRNRTVARKILHDQRGLAVRGPSAPARLRARPAQLRLCRSPAEPSSSSPGRRLLPTSPRFTGISTGTYRSASSTNPRAEA